jgi:chromosome segregation ATPase
MEKLIMEFLTYLISNADKITAAAGIIIVVVILAYLVNEIGKRTESQSRRDDEFKTQLLELHTRTAGNNERIVTLMEVHEKAALERSQAQEVRDKERSELARQQTDALTKITDYLAVVDETKKTVDTIQSITSRIPGSVSDLGTDMTGLIDRRTQDVNTNIEKLQVQLETSLQLVEGAIKKLQPRLDGIAEIQDSHVENESQRHTELVTEVRSIGSVLSTVIALVDTVHQLVKSLITLPAPEIWNEETETTAIIPPKKLVDDDGNVKSLPLAGNDNPENLDKAS